MRGKMNPWKLKGVASLLKLVATYLELIYMVPSKKK
jgi:hypothetical protein